MDTTVLDEKPKQAIVIFQGGGALGAYECGAFQMIAVEMDKNQEELVVVAGTSIGMLNAAIIAKSYQDQKAEHRGKATATQAAQDLKTFWTTVIPHRTPQLFPLYSGLQFPLADIMQRSLNFWINIFLGNPHVFTPNLSALSPFAPAHYSTAVLKKTLLEHFGPYYEQGSQPRLIVEAVNVQSGHPETFDSGVERITPEMLTACGSLPTVVPAQKVDGEYYWDGGVYMNTPLGPVMNALQKAPFADALGTIPVYQVYIVNDHAHQGPLPQDIWGVVGRELDILLADKSDDDIKAAERLNEYIRLVQHLHQWVDASHPTMPSDLEYDIKTTYKQMIGEIPGKQRAILKFVQLRRGGLPGDYWSSTGDFSLSRIEELIAQGERETQQQLEDRESLHEENVNLRDEIESLQKEIKKLQTAPVY